MLFGLLYFVTKSYDLTGEYNQNLDACETRSYDLTAQLNKFRRQNLDPRKRRNFVTQASVWFYWSTDWCYLDYYTSSQNRMI